MFWLFNRHHCHLWKFLFFTVILFLKIYLLLTFAFHLAPLVFETILSVLLLHLKGFLLLRVGKDIFSCDGMCWRQYIAYLKCINKFKQKVNEDEHVSMHCKTFPSHRRIYLYVSFQINSIKSNSPLLHSRKLCERNFV